MSRVEEIEGELQEIRQKREALVARRAELLAEAKRIKMESQKEGTREADNAMRRFLETGELDYNALWKRKLPYDVIVDGRVMIPAGKPVARHHLHYMKDRRNDLSLHPHPS